MFQSPTLFALKDHFWDQNGSVKVIDRAIEITAFESSCIHRSFPRSCLDFLFQIRLKIDTLECFIVLFLHQAGELCYFHWRRLKALFQSQNDKNLNCHLITCSRQKDIFAKTRSRMTTVITFSRQNDAGSPACTTLYWKSLIIVVVPVLESVGL